MVSLALDVCASSANLAGLLDVEMLEVKPELIPVVGRHIPVGFLPDSKAVSKMLLQVMPPAPAEGSAEQAYDQRISQESLQQFGVGTDRWQQAQQDAVIMFPQVMQSFSCALGIKITEAATPYLYMMMRRIDADVILSNETIKKNYRRTRPSAENNQAGCTPQFAAYLAKSASYPSGHAASGWAWALVLSELVPSRAQALMKRAMTFGQNRVVCSAHWQKDVEVGRLVGSAVVALEHAQPDFQAYMAQAKQEVDRKNQ